MEHRGWIVLSGMIWFVGGIFLLHKGVSYIGNSWLLFPAVFLGFLKGRIVFAKTVRRIVGRIYSLSLPIRLFDVYPFAYWCLIGGMVSLGMILRFFPESVRGVVDVAVGSALVQGAVLYFRSAKQEAVPSK